MAALLLWLSSVAIVAVTVSILVIVVIIILFVMCMLINCQDKKMQVWYSNNNDWYKNGMLQDNKDTNKL